MLRSLEKVKERHNDIRKLIQQNPKAVPNLLEELCSLQNCEKKLTKQINQIPQQDRQLQQLQLQQLQLQRQQIKELEQKKQKLQKEIEEAERINVAQSLLGLSNLGPSD